MASVAVGLVVGSEDGGVGSREPGKALGRIGIRAPIIPLNEQGCAYFGRVFKQNGSGPGP